MKKKAPSRQCIGCGEMKIKREMLRVIKSPEGDIQIDDTGKMNGRGAYVCHSKECLSKALKNKGLERSLKVKIPTEIYDKLMEELSNLETKQ